MLLQLLSHRIEHLIHLLQDSVRDLTLDLLQDGVDRLGDLILEHLVEIDLGAPFLDVVRSTRPIVPGLLLRLVLPRLLALLTSLGMLRSRPGVVLPMISARGRFSLVVSLTVGITSCLVIGIVCLSAARLRRGWLLFLISR
ncbi:MAG: hypothetical protein U0893_23060 [Chloroflexota bacterium]